MGCYGGSSEEKSNGLIRSFAGRTSSTIRGLDDQQKNLEIELATLPPSVGVDSSVRLGWHSPILPTETSVVWAMIDLGKSWPLDQIAVVPASGEANSRSGPGYGFPKRFRIETANSSDFSEPLLIADFTNQDVPNPGAMPIVVDARSQKARFIKLTATEAWQRGDSWCVAIGELIVISGKRNVAVGKPVQCSKSSISLPNWSPLNLTDGQSLLGPPVGPQFSSSNGYLAIHEETSDVEKWVQVDLEQSFSIDEIRLFPARPTDFPDSPGNGFPARFRVEISNQWNFDSKVTVFDSGEEDVLNPGDNPFTVDAMGHEARFVRVHATRLFDRGTACSFALAELEVWSNDSNVALKRPVSALDVFENRDYPRWRPEYLVDGFNSRHQIASFNDWISGLARRRAIDGELAILDQERSVALERWLTSTMRMAAAVFAALGVCAIWLARRAKVTRKRAMESLRRQIACDLHDEIGSQLSSIALAAELAAQRLDNSLAARQTLTEIETIARETYDSMHDIVWLLKPGNATLKGLVERIRESAAMQWRARDYQFEIKGKLDEVPLALELARNTLLCCKEAIANVAKHSRATQIAVEIEILAKEFRVSISDNGIGFDPASQAGVGNGIENMLHRARSVKANLTIDSRPKLGTTVRLRVPLH